MSPRLRIGLTGGIASGKTTVANRFRTLGISVIDADAVSRSLVLPGQPALAAIVSRFGPDIAPAGGALDRRKLRDIVFADRDARADLEAILHPRIREEMERLAAMAPGPYLVLEIPLLIEGGATDRVDRILVVDVDESVQIERLTARDGGSAEQAREILAAQASRAARLARADDLLVNTGNLADLHAAVDRLHAQYLVLAGTAPA
jgi:dephospho-CoA kinase